MTAEEYLRAIYTINPDAHVVVWEKDGKLVPKWDAAHTGKQPTEKDCEAILSQVREEMATETAEQEKEATIQAEIRAVAIDSLIQKGTLTLSDKATLMEVKG